MDKDFNTARIVWGDLQLHKSSSKDEVPFGSVELEYIHREILEHLSYERWTDRRIVVNRVGIRRKTLNTHIKYLKENGYVIERKKPTEKRMKQYMRESP